jgi:hypothetical protein
VEKLEATKKQKKEHAELLKKSQVRRGEQGHGALEPDIVTPSPWWFECGTGTGDGANGRKKLEQALADMAKMPPIDYSYAAAITRERGRQKIMVTTKLTHLVFVTGGRYPCDVLDPIVTLDFEHFHRILREMQ